VAVALVGLDVASKAWARRELRHSPKHFGVVDLVLGSNSGVAFGVGAGSSRWLVLTTTGAVVVVLVIVAWWLRPTVAAGLVVGGGVANLLDRSGDGVVTDFVSVGWWPTFNLADSAICVGAAWLILASWWSARAGRDDQHRCRDRKGGAL
jgi:signal peptidase II